MIANVALLTCNVPLQVWVYTFYIFVFSCRLNMIQNFDVWSQKSPKGTAATHLFAHIHTDKPCCPLPDIFWFCHGCDKPQIYCWWDQTMTGMTLVFLLILQAERFPSHFVGLPSPKHLHKKYPLFTQTFSYAPRHGQINLSTTWSYLHIYPNGIYSLSFSLKSTLRKSTSSDAE